MRRPPAAVLAQLYQCFSQPCGAHVEPLACLLLLTQYRDVRRARRVPRSRDPLVMACLSCGYASRQSQVKNEEESHGNRSAGNS